MLGKKEFEEIAYLRSPKAIRDRCSILFDLGCEDRLEHFRCDLTQLERVADYVIQVIREDYPDLQIPFHSRWRHFQVGTHLAQLDQQLLELTPLAKAQAKFDLAVVSVLLDAGAGAVWQYHEPGTDLVFSRSEGLAVASFQMFCQGTFSSHSDKLQADALGLQKITADVLAAGFQISDKNPLVGLPGRVQLLRRLGQAMVDRPQLFGNDNPRPGGLVNYLLAKATNGQLTAEAVFRAVLAGLGDIWTGRLQISGINLGDVWRHSAIADTQNLSSGLVPFHKLSQWLTYSLLEPLQELGLEITGLDALTGLPEYRNGGLCLDLGLLQPKHSNVLQQPHSVDSEIIVEWRALTVISLDYIAATIRSKLGMNDKELPLVKVLQGGTWSAGRKIAAYLRSGVPPIQIESDGTVF
ncbi:URC4/urg3 family protein [Gloeocapsopsis dulcis]|uniref:Uracil phosphoribosyltransferase n=1 Tax=Gloeocapsopsis dulcis AAB1 = 1H9 TaxID=1433147 RepID=A0A6N8G1D9_9CHRO|nr:URC4/urg3 family protein [Gloeocapsopsis dulcis]MUL39021.1 uracil phosphoribosyltransferase [Gloeocapsopsis dulcis AAB1 = 1H9]WNN90570.1 URC4/urg3 family protein [Gloeocapsopsis dulcis]